MKQSVYSALDPSFYRETAQKRKKLKNNHVMFNREIVVLMLRLELNVYGQLSTSVWYHSILEEKPVRFYVFFFYKRKQENAVVGEEWV